MYEYVPVQYIKIKSSLLVASDTIVIRVTYEYTLKEVAIRII